MERNKKILATILALGMVLTAFSAIASALWSNQFQVSGYVYVPGGAAQIAGETAASFEMMLCVDEDGDGLYWPGDATDWNHCYSDPPGMNGYSAIDDSFINFAYYALTMQSGEPGGFNMNYKIWVNGSVLNTPFGDGYCVDHSDGVTEIFTFPPAGAAQSLDIDLPPAAGETATATGPIGAGPNNVIITYTWTLSPASVDLFYSENGGPFLAAGNDATVDGSFAWVCPGVNGDTYDWIANVPGGLDDGVGIPGGPPEAGTYILAAVTPPIISGFAEAGNLLIGDHNDLDLVITATVDDSTQENSNIVSADISVDGGPWMAMAAQDGAFDSPTEVVTYTFNPGVGFYAEGLHPYVIRATDADPATNPGVADDFTISDTTTPTGVWLTTPPNGGTHYIGTPAIFQCSYEDFTEYDTNVAVSYFEYRVNGGPWQPAIAWNNVSFSWGTFTNILQYTMATGGYADGDLVEYQGAVQDTGTGGPTQTLLLMQSVTMIDAPPGVQDPYPVYGRVFLYDGTSVGGYLPLLGGAGCPVAVSWINSTTAAVSTINTVTNAAGQYSVDILNYTDGDPFGIEVAATFNAPFNNNGYNWTVLDVVAYPGAVEVNVTCGIPYNVTITTPIAGASVIAGMPFLTNWQITDRDGLLAQGYFTTAGVNDPFSWLCEDVTFVAPPATTWDGTATAAGPGIVGPAMGTDTLIVNLGPTCWINISEGGAELPAPDNFLTPWGAFTQHIGGVIVDGWLKDYDNITLNVTVGGFDWLLDLGWNIVSAPQMPVGYGIDAAFDADDALNRCFWYTNDPNMAMAERILPGTNPSQYNINDYGIGEAAAFDIDSVHGYWIYCSVAGPFIVHFNATNYTFGMGFNQVAIEDGWNLLGFTHNYSVWGNATVGPTGLPPVAADYTNGNVDGALVTGGAVGPKIVATWWNIGPQWYNSYVETTWFPGMATHNWAWDLSFSQQPGNGMFLWCAGAGTTITFNVEY